MRHYLSLGITLGVILAVAAPAAAQTVFNSKATYLAATGATQATTPYPALGFSPQASLVSGSVTLSRVTAGNSLYFDAWMARLPGNTLSIDGREDLNVAFAAPVGSFGFDFVEPQFDPLVNAPFEESTFTVVLRAGSNIVGSFAFNAPNDTAAFVGASNALAFDNVQIRETIGGFENEFYGQFYTSPPAVGGAVPEPGTWAMMLLGFGAAGYAMRRRAKVRRTNISFA